MVPPIFAQLIKDATGLDASAVGSSTIDRAVRERMRSRMLTDTDAYENLLRSSSLEFQQLIEAVVVPETWFFRDPKAFTEMVRAFASTGAHGRHGGVYRVLCVPCSTGEEPYSMAMALLDANVPPARFHIDAVDISARALRHAQNAVFGNNSFRGDDVAFRSRFFAATATGYRLSDAVRALVHFEEGNILAPGFQSGAEKYDAIFCRNLLVYFDRDTQSRAIAVLRSLLRENGVVFVGPAEAGTMFEHGFVWSEASFAFAFREAGARVVPRGAGAALMPRGAVAGVPPLRIASSVTRSPRPHVIAMPAKARIDEASRLADSGRSDEAVALCNALLACGPSAPASHLLGLIHNSAGDLAEAERHFRQALYLDPDHAEALIHLALLLESRHDVEGARLLRKRALRVERAMS